MRGLSRRAAAATMASGLCAAPALHVAALLPLGATTLASRLNDDMLTPLTDAGMRSLQGELRYPPWLLGTWNVRNALLAYSSPLGDTFVDEYTVASAEDDVRSHWSAGYRLRWIPAPPSAGAPRLSAVQDRAFNGAQETAAFMDGDDRGEVRAAWSTSDRAPHGLLMIDVPRDGTADGARAASGGVPDDRVSIELEVRHCASEELPSGDFVTSELLLQTVRDGSGGARGSPPEVTLVESITQYEPPDDRRGAVLARNRLAQYLVPPPAGAGAGSWREAALAALARGRAVSIYDYGWLLVPAERADSSERLQSKAGPKRDSEAPARRPLILDGPVAST